MLPHLEVIARQCGVAARDQLAHAGLSRRGLERAVATGVLQRRGPRLVIDPQWSSEGDERAELRHRLFAALCECAPRQRATALVFRRSAAALWGLDGLAGPAGPAAGAVPTEIAVARGNTVSGSVFRVRPVAPAERAEVEGLPVTSPVRTLVDIGQVVEAETLERALESALRKRLATMDELLSALDAAARLRGTSALRSLLTGRPPGLPPTESDAETLFVQLARRAGFPAPLRQFTIPTAEGNFRVDFAWPVMRIAIEIDGAAVHASAGALARDLRRQNAIVLAFASAGWVLLRFSWYDLVAEPYVSQTCAKLREAWSIAGSRPLVAPTGGRMADFANHNS